MRSDLRTSHPWQHWSDPVGLYLDLDHPERVQKMGNPKGCCPICHLGWTAWTTPPFEKWTARNFASEKWMVWKRIRLPFLGCSFLKGELLNFRSVFLEGLPSLLQLTAIPGPFYWAGSQKEMSSSNRWFSGGSCSFSWRWLWGGTFLRKNEMSSSFRFMNPWEGTILRDIDLFVCLSWVPNLPKKTLGRGKIPYTFLPFDCSRE